ncbi:hypothetical protein ZIOFF_071608 [Zingiber officinale]|uniref:40S ribosomal protein S8 n=1 Tax=Zingiber officinale TaxID=94328 RepID=A0A8J5ENS4_ZINOF|nr:hypothetical protein ZIOFF_071608 [Zingiber officinale]
MSVLYEALQNGKEKRNLNVAAVQESKSLNFRNHLNMWEISDSTNDVALDVVEDVDFSNQQEVQVLLENYGIHKSSKRLNRLIAISRSEETELTNFLTGNLQYMASDDFCNLCLQIKPMTQLLLKEFLNLEHILTLKEGFEVKMLEDCRIAERNRFEEMLISVIKFTQGLVAYIRIRMSGFPGSSYREVLDHALFIEMTQQQVAQEKSISRDSMHKRRATGGKKKAWRKKRKYELGRQPANTKLSSNKTVRRVRVRGGNVKWRALRLDTGNYSWGSEAVTRKTRILDVVYNASNNELVRTQTLVKSAIVQVDAAPFKAWYLQHYGVELGKKKKSASATKKETTEGQEGEPTAEVKKSSHVLRKLEKRQQDRKLDSHIEDQFGTGRLLAAISSRPGQCGRADGYILEGKELEFYMKKIQKKKGKGAGAA